MKKAIFIGFLFLTACTKQNMGLHAVLSITPTSGGWQFNPNGSSGPISSYSVRLYEITGQEQIWPTAPWNPSQNSYGFYGPEIYDRAVLIVMDKAGNVDSAVVNTQF